MLPRTKTHTQTGLHSVAFVFVPEYKNEKCKWSSLQEDVVHVQCEELLPALFIKQTGRLRQETSVRQTEQTPALKRAEDVPTCSTSLCQILAVTLE